jgi:uncharacterized LabA/DUF88 family protein
MFNRRFMDLVRTQLIRVLAQQARDAKAANGTTSERTPQPLRFMPSDTVAFVDLQNLHYFLKENCRVPATAVHIPNLLRGFGEMHGMQLAELQIFTGIHDPRREPLRHEAMAKRLRWLTRCGAKVTALPLSYYTDRETQVVRAQEKGVDVRIASEILRAVNDGLCQAVVISQDKDIAQAILVAAEMAAERGRSFRAFTPELIGTEWEHNGKCGMHGLYGTTRLPMSVDFVRRFVRRLDSAHEAPASDGPLDVSQPQSHESAA